jgi:type I restriction enzyme S subunit
MVDKDNHSVPDTWKVLKVRDITKFHKQGYYTQESYTSTGKYLLLRGTDMQNPLIDLSTTPKINANNADYEAYKVLEGDFLFVRSGAIGRYGIAKKNLPKSIFGSYLINFRFSNTIIQEYFGYFYESDLALNQIMAITQGGGNLNINAENIKALNILLPPKTEQKSIVKVLSDTDALIDALEKLIAKKEAIKTGTMQELLTGKKRLDGFSGEWEEKKICEIAEIATGTTPPTRDNSNYGTEYSFVSPVDLGKNKYIVKTQKYLSKKGFSISRIFPSNSILYTCIGSTIGKLGISDKELTSNQQINAIFPNESFSTNFLYYNLLHQTSYIRSLASEQAVPMINKSDFGEVILKMPKRDEQIVIATILSDMDKELQSLKLKLSKLKAIKEGMMQELLTGKIRLLEVVNDRM